MSFLRVTSKSLKRMSLISVWPGLGRMAPKELKVPLMPMKLRFLHDGFGRRHALEIEVLRPRRDVDDAAGGAFGGDVAEGDVLVVLRGVGAQLEGRDADAAGDRAVFGDNVADDGGLAAAGEHAAAALEGAVADADVLDGRAVRVFHGVRALGAFAGDAVVGDGEEAAIDGDVAGAVDVDAVGAGGLPVVVGHLEVDVMHEDAVVVVEMAVPELRILEGDAFDLDVLASLR